MSTIRHKIPSFCRLQAQVSRATYLGDRDAELLAERIECRPQRRLDRHARALALRAGAVLWVAGHEHLVEPARAGSPRSSSSRPASTPANAVAPDRPLGVDRQVEVARVLALLAAAVEVADAVGTPAPDRTPHSTSTISARP